jgi:hypothetical protein
MQSQQQRMEVDSNFSFHAKLKQKVGWFGDKILKQKRNESESVFWE